MVKIARDRGSLRDRPIVPEAYPLAQGKHTLSPRGEPLSVDAKERLRQRSGAWPESPTPPPLALQALPVTTVGAFVMYAASDTMSQSVAQQCEHQPSCNIDYKRAARTGLSASVLSGALAYFYYAWLDRAIGVPRALSSRLVPGGLAARALLPALPIAGKIAIDIGLFEPVYDTLYITLQVLTLTLPAR